MDIEFQTAQKVLQNLSYQSPMAIFFTWKCLVTFFSKLHLGCCFLFNLSTPSFWLKKYINILQVLSKSFWNFKSWKNAFEEDASDKTDILEDKRLEPTAITHEKKGKWSEPNLHEDMFQPLIFTWYPKQPFFNRWKWWFPTIFSVMIWFIFQLKQPLG